MNESYRNIRNSYSNVVRKNKTVTFPQSKPWKEIMESAISTEQWENGNFFSGTSKVTWRNLVPFF